MSKWQRVKYRIGKCIGLYTTQGDYFNVYTHMFEGERNEY